MLKRIYIDNFRCFVNFELNLEKVSLLLGPNGSGKTSIFNVDCKADRTGMDL